MTVEQPEMPVDPDWPGAGLPGSAAEEPVPRHSGPKPVGVRRPGTGAVLLITSGIDGVGGIQRYSRSLRQALASCADLTAVDLGLGTSRRRRLAAAAGAVRSAWRHRPDLVVLAHVGLGPVGWAIRLLGLNYAVVTYGVEVWGPVRWRQRVTMRLAYSVWPLSRFTRSELQRLYPGSRLGEPLGGCVDEQFLAAEAEPAVPFRVLTVARAADAEYKGLGSCVAALATLADRHAIEYRVVGAGQTRASVAALLGGPIPSFVTVLGGMDDEDLVEEYRRASVVVLVSGYRSGADPIGEGLGLVLLEAAAVGVPGIASSAGGGPETVVDGVTGFVVPPGDPFILVARLTQLLDEECRRAMGRAAKVWVREHHGPRAFAGHVDRAVRDSLRR